MARRMIVDAQQALGFLVEQTSHIETEVYKIEYPDIQYPNLVPVDTSANEWTKSVTFFSMDKVGAADWFHHAATDMRLADVVRSKFEQGIEMAGIGYRYTLEEIGQALLIPGTNLTSERADAARRAYEEFVERVALSGDASKNWTGLINNASVTRADAANDGTGATRTWSTKTADQIIRDINDALTGVYTASNTVEMADTILLPVSSLALAAAKRIDATTMTVLQYIMQYNVYTLQTGQPLMIRAVRDLETAGNGPSRRMVVYRRDPRVVKMHIPMPHQFLDVWQRGPITFDIPGIFRLGGVEIRRPGAFRYIDGI
jgi:hypothetical protein